MLTLYGSMSAYLVTYKGNKNSRFYPKNKVKTAIKM